MTAPPPAPSDAPVPDPSAVPVAAAPALLGDLPGAAVPDAGVLDAADPLARFVDRFVPSPQVSSYLDGNSLGRPLRATAGRLQDFLTGDWGGRLIRSWDERWMQLPLELGDRIGSLVLGAAPGQTVVADSTTVMLYKLVRAAVDARPGRTEVVVDTENFPTDRFVLEGIAAERGLVLRWVTGEPDTGMTPELVAGVVGPDTALVVVSEVAYRSGYLADVRGIVEVAHAAGALVLSDVCHSAGALPVRLDEDGVDVAVGCTYKYLNGGPGSPAFGYVRAELQDELRQPVQGWMGAGDVFGMTDAYAPATGMRRYLSGTPPVVGMLAMQDMLDVIEEAGVEAVRAKSLALTDHALALVDAWLAPLGAVVASPREHARRGGHVLVRHPASREVTAQLWERDVIPDFRNPNGIRIGLSPLSTSFTELERGMAAVRDLLAAHGDGPAGPTTGMGSGTRGGTGIGSGGGSGADAGHGGADPATPTA